MSYTLRTVWEGAYGQHTRTRRRRGASIVLVGCGGTGGFLATAIARLLLGHNDAKLCLVDLDRVGPENLGRQAFTAADLGRFKSQVLAERIVRDFGLRVSYSVLPYDSQLHRQIFDMPAELALIVGAVDNAAARKAIAATLTLGGVWWLDCGNGYASGQVLLGNVLQAKEMRQSFNAETDECYALPAPSLQRPDLLNAPPLPVEDTNCAVAVERAEQSATINQTMAAIAAAYIERLLLGTCTWMATYADMENGMVQTVPADPQAVARILRKPAGPLMVRPRKEKAA